MTEFTGIHARKTSAPAAAAPCPCGSGRHYADCCGQLIDLGAIPATAEALMRSRFTAYATRRQPYLVSSWHSSTRPPGLTLEPSVRWTRLEILDTADGATPDEAYVEFLAHCRVDGAAQSLHERSRFLREQGRWRYVDGETPATLKRASAKVGRNAPCPCGSGKKAKHCCG